VVGRPDLVSRQFDESAREDVAELLKTRTRAEWVADLETAEACVAPVLDLGEALAHPMAQARSMVRDAPLDASGTATALTLGAPIRIDGRPLATGSAPPRLGADTEDLAAEVGLSPQEIEALLRSGVLRSNVAPSGPSS